jgi:hypothetical protein
MTASRAFFLTLPLLAITQGGCAAAVWHPKVESISGEYKSGDYKNTQALSEKADAIPEGQATEVVAVVEQLLPGMDYRDGVFTADAARYEVLGKVSAKPAGEFFYPYKEGWRKPVCWPQSVLTVATLFTWLAVPTSYGCHVGTGSVDERRDSIVESMKRATKVMGGDLVVVAGFQGQVTITATRSSATVSTLEAVEGVGWAIRVKGGAKGATTPGGASASL